MPAWNVSANSFATNVSAASTIYVGSIIGYGGWAAGFPDIAFAWCCPGTYTLSNLWCRIEVNPRGSATVMYVTKNGAITALAVTIPALATGDFLDAVNTASYLEGDTITKWIATGVGAGAMWVAGTSVRFESATNIAPNGTMQPSTSVRTGSRYFPINGIPFGSIAEGETYEYVKTATTYSKMAVTIRQNAVAVNSTLVFRINLANGNQTITVGAGLTGIFADMVNTDAVVNGSLINLLWTPGDANNWDIRGFAIRSSSNVRQTMDHDTPYFQIPRNVTVYHAPEGRDSNSTESREQARSNATFTARNANLLVVAPNSQQLVCMFRVNGGDTALSITVPDTLTGYFENIVNQVNVVPADLINWRVTSSLGGIGDFTRFTFLGFEQNAPAATAAPAGGMASKMIGARAI